MSALVDRHKKGFLLKRAKKIILCSHADERKKSKINIKNIIKTERLNTTYPTCTGSSSTLTCPAISSISRARWQIDLAWCVHGSGRPLTVMYLSPTVSTCVSKRRKKNHFDIHKFPLVHIKSSVPAVLQRVSIYAQHS